MKRLKYIIFFTGIIILLGTVNSFIKTYYFINNSTITTGTIVDIRNERREYLNDGVNREKRTEFRKIYIPRIEFKTDKGRVVQFWGLQTFKSKHSINDTVEIRYHQDEPTIAEENTFSTIWSSIIFRSILGTLLVFLTRKTFLRLLRRQR